MGPGEGSGLWGSWGAVVGAAGGLWRRGQPRSGARSRAHEAGLVAVQWLLETEL